MPLTYLEADGSRFWQVEVTGKKTMIKFGPLGTSGQEQSKGHTSAAKATAYAKEQTKLKLDCGYVAKDKPEDDDDEDEESEEEEEPVKAKKAPAKASGKKRKKEEEEEDEDDDEGEDEDEDDDEDPPSKKLQKVAQPEGGRRGVVDRELPGGGSGAAIHEGWTAKLNQTNTGGGANNNKFYIIQLVKLSNGKYGVWNRWGRVGERGQDNGLKTYPSLGAAQTDFKKKFKDKTRNDFESTVLEKTSEFKKVPGKYGFVEVDEDDEGGDDDNPLGKLSESQIQKGQATLKELRELLEAKKKPKASSIDALTSQYYTQIPHDFGRRAPPPMNNLEDVEEHEEKLKFMLRMGFDELEGEEEEDGLTPLDGLWDLDCPNTLADSKPTGASAADLKKAVSTAVEMLAKQTIRKEADPHAKDASPKELFGAVLLYTSNCIYRELNQALRDEDRKAVKRKYFKYVRLLFQSFDFLRACSESTPATLWRGVGVDLSKTYKKDSVVTWWGVSSCTSEESVARGFAGGCAGQSTLLSIKTKSGVDISSISYYQSEKETLLAPGTKLKVLSTKQGNGYTEISLEEVGSALATRK